jgi:hypothetical protein
MSVPAIYIAAILAAIPRAVDQLFGLVRGPAGTTWGMLDVLRRAELFAARVRNDFPRGSPGE